MIAESQTIIAENDISDPDKAQILSLYCAMPLWVVNLWKDQGMTCKEIADLCTSLHSVAPVGLRINAEIIDRDLAIDILRRDGIPCKTGKYSPHAIIMPERIPLTHLDIFMSGAIEVQDEGSQLISFAVSPEEHWRILDYCAGAGGKSLHLAMLQHDQCSHPNLPSFFYLSLNSVTVSSPSHGIRGSQHTHSKLLQCDPHFEN